MVGREATKRPTEAGLYESGTRVEFGKLNPEHEHEQYLAKPQREARHELREDRHPVSVPVRV